MRRLVIWSTVALLFSGLGGCVFFNMNPDGDSLPDPDPTPGATLFYDDFNDGFDPAWSVTTGWGLSDGTVFHAQNGSRYAYLEQGADWDDYVVEAELDPRGEGAGLLLRCQEDLQNYVLVGGTDSEIWWKVYVDGEAEYESSEYEPGFFDGMQTIRAVVSGSRYRIYVNGLERLDFTDTHFARGLPGITVWGYLVDDLSARFDSFQVVDLE